MIKHLLIAFASALGIFVCLVLIAILQLPNISNLEKCFTTTMFEVKVCPNTKSFVRLSQIPKHTVNAIIISEDAGFYSHKGFDWDEIKNSFQKNLEKKTFARGGSTISQQLVKNLFLTQEKSIIRKLKEAFLTYQLEKKYSKKFILELYLNVVEFDTKVYGIARASQHYFKKPVSTLNPAESAFLAQLLPNPRKFNRGFFAGRTANYVVKRSFNILHKLRSVGRISEEEYAFSKMALQSYPWSQKPIELQMDESVDLISSDENEEDIPSESGSTELKKPDSILDSEAKTEDSKETNSNNNLDSETDNSAPIEKEESNLTEPSL